MKAAYILNRSEPVLNGDILESFALEELLCRKVGEGSPPIIHFWRHRRALVVGLRDRQLRRSAMAMESFRSQGYSVGVRNSGGAAVPLDENVINVTLILPKLAGDLKYKADFERMFLLLRDALAPYTAIQSGEVVGSYCPGEWDLSIQGRKFCGIAQRRQLHALAVQAFVILRGSGEEKAKQAQAFYRSAADEGADGYLQVESDSMCSLQQLGCDISLDEFSRSVCEVFKNHFAVDELFPLHELPASSDVVAMMDSLKQRYDLRE